MIWGLIAAFAVLALVSRLTGFASQNLQDFAGKSPVFDPKRELDGPMLCEGVIYGPMGRVAARFVARMEGRWSGDKGVLTEHFTYDTGVEQDREWRLTIGRDGSLRTEADDLVGAGSGQTAGPVLRLLYRLRLPATAGGHVVDVTDWLYLMDNGTIMNRSRFTKWGIPVGELVATMRRVAA